MLRVWEETIKIVTKIVPLIPANNASVVQSSLKFSQTQFFYIFYYEVLFHYLMNLFLWMLVQWTSQLCPPVTYQFFFIFLVQIHFNLFEKVRKTKYVLIFVFIIISIFKLFSYHSETGNQDYQPEVKLEQQTDFLWALIWYWKRCRSFRIHDNSTISTALVEWLWQSVSLQRFSKCKFVSETFKVVRPA